ncbi:MAG: hypothetical protein QXJ45_01400 [Thermoproteota archaeon]
MVIEKQEADYRRQGGEVQLLPLHTKWGLFPITVLIFSLTFILSSMIPIEKSLAEEIMVSLKEQFLNSNLIVVFLNNLLLSLVMMIPVFGFVFSIFSSSLNGTAISAISIVTGSPPLHIAIKLLSNPGVILEILAFGLASAQSLAGFFAIVEKRFRRELKEYLTTIVVVIGLLLISALLEMFFQTISS